MTERMGYSVKCVSLQMYLTEGRTAATEERTAKECSEVTLFQWNGHSTNCQDDRYQQ